jgi:hypothetical protein
MKWILAIIQFKFSNEKRININFCRQVFTLVFNFLVSKSIIKSLNLSEVEKKQVVDTHALERLSTCQYYAALPWRDRLVSIVHMFIVACSQVLNSVLLFFFFPE